MICLNPCCSGRWSRTVRVNAENGARTVGLNPCCSGRWSRTYARSTASADVTVVLILVVVEDGLVRRSVW